MTRTREQLNLTVTMKVLFWALVFAFPLLCTHQQICKLRGKFSLNHSVEEGEVIIGGMFNVHSDRIEILHSFKDVPQETQCRRFDFRAFRLVQTMIFAIEEINKNPALLPNVSLGYRIYDDCSSPIIATKAALALINGKGQVVDEKCNQRPLVSALIGGGSSSESIAITRLISPFRIPLVSYFSTCACLSNKDNFPTFYRTIPSDYHQSKFLAHIVKNFGWTWIGTIRVNNDYGNFGMQAFIETVEKLGVCIAFSESFYRTDPRERMMEIVEVIKKASTKVVVAFSSTQEMRILLKELLRQNVTDIQWIGSEAWVTADLLAPEENVKILVGTIGSAIRRSEIPGLREFLLQVKPFMVSGDVLVKEFWETAFQCSLNPADAINPANSSVEMRRCTGNERLEELQNAYSDLEMDGSTYNVYKAVYALAHAFHNMFACKNGEGPFVNSTCIIVSNFEPWQVLRYMQTVNFRTKNGDNVYFDEKGDPVAAYDLVNWQTNSKGVAHVQTIGYYDGSAPPGQQVVLNERSIVWRGGQRTVPRAVCAENCPLGTRKLIRKGRPICCFDCTPCSEGEVSNTTDSTDCVKCPTEYWPNISRDKCVPKEIEFLSYTEILGIVLATLALSGLKKCRTVLNPKCEDKDYLKSIDNWQPITIGPNLLRLFTKILAKRLSKTVKINPRQKGFLAATPGCNENIVILENIIKRAKHNHKDLAVVFVDLARAFNLVGYNLLIKILQRVQLPKAFAGLIKDLYSGNITVVEGNRNFTTSVNIERSVKQGDPLSPILFNIALDPLVCSLEKANSRVAMPLAAEESTARLWPSWMTLPF
ncbi:hypothetical protein chiPu_0010732 [Chiloscyllium punctatum]|uniref:Reverse transcriptase domain-containing protein n=1 Tax=Chiloscyllium punctatum TaxID=137246 RepID=A0A401SPG2_CHIPU|nr:hypothetical protein [Chiloscyllium punctatum]